MYHIIVNPASRSGKGNKIWNTLSPILNGKQIVYQVYFTEKVGHATDIAKKLTANLTAPIRLIILGGDGTINEVIQGICDFKNTSIAYIPTGSSNDLARDLKLEIDPVKALDKILKADQILEMDLGLISCNNGYYDRDGSRIDNVYQRYFNVSSGIGFDAAVCEEALSSKLKDLLNHLGLGKLTYLGIALHQLLKGSNASCQVTLDENPPFVLDRLIFAAAMNHRFEGGGFMFAPDADYTDTHLNLCIAHSMSFLRAIRILPTAFSGKHIRFPEVFYQKASRIDLETTVPLCIHTDGEVHIYADSVTYSVSEHKLRLIPTNL